METLVDSPAQTQPAFSFFRVFYYLVVYLEFFRVHLKYSDFIFYFFYTERTARPALGGWIVRRTNPSFKVSGAAD